MIPRQGLGKVAEQLEAEGKTVVAGGGKYKERLRRTAGGKKEGRRADIIYQEPTGKEAGVNIGRTYKDGKPVKREQDALDDLNGPGQLPTVFIPYDR